MTVELDSLQILQGCVILRGTASVRTAAPRLALQLGNRPLAARTNWIDDPRPTWFGRLASRLDRGTSGPRRARFVLRALAGWDLDGRAAADLGLTLRDGRLTTTVDDLPARFRDRDSAPGVEALYERFRTAVSASPGARILELGARARSGHVRRDHFPGAEHIGLDIRPGAAVDLVGDAHMLPFAPGSIAFVSSISVFEHLAWPWKVVLELGSALRPGGLVYTQSHQTWPLHDEPWDFFRFSRSAWHALFSDAAGFEVVEAVDAMPARVVPLRQTGDPSTIVERGTGCLVSACLARKVGPARLTWDAVPDLADLADYPA